MQASTADAPAVQASMADAANGVAQASAPPLSSPVASGAGRVPAEVRVVCGSLGGRFLTEAQRIVADTGVAGSSLKPSGFEKEAGRGSSSKWKSTIRVPVAGGKTITLEAYMKQFAGFHFIGARTKK